MPSNQKGPYLLLIDGDALEGLLDDPAAVHLQCQLLDVGSELKAREKERIHISSFPERELRSPGNGKSLKGLLS